MAMLPLFVLALACLCVALPHPKPPALRNTIFAEEKLEGEVFYKIDNEIEASNDVLSYRLPTTTKPKHYDIDIWTDFKSNDERSERMFGGEVHIQLTATQENVDQIVLHADDLTIENITLTINDDDVPISWEIDNPQNHFLRITLESGTLKYDENEDIIYTLHITFDAPMRTDMYGIYESWYRVGDGPDDVK